MKPAFAIAIAGSALVAGCAPLSQAGLVYSSRVQVGLNLEAATPENPGVRINMGVNASDTAYVPVVVGRACELSNRPDCNQGLVPVFGQSNVATSDRDNQAGSRRPGQPPPPGQPKSMQAVAPTEATQNAEPAGVAPAEENAIAQAAIELLKSRESRDEIDDALSVYGTFDSNATAGAPNGTGSANAGLRLGRTFSTGVASQNLTRGISAATRVNALTACLVAARANAQAGPADQVQASTRSLSAACAAAVVGE